MEQKKIIEKRKAREARKKLMMDLPTDCLDCEQACFIAGSWTLKNISRNKLYYGMSAIFIAGSWFSKGSIVKYLKSSRNKEMDRHIP